MRHQLQPNNLKSKYTFAFFTVKSLFLITTDFAVNSELISNYGKKRPLLTILVEKIIKFSSYLGYIAFSGTALTLHKIGTIYSTLGKPEMPRLYINGIPVESSDFSQVSFKNASSNLDTLDKVENFVRMHVNLDGCDKDSLKELSNLRGRKRISANLIKIISQNSGKENGKLQILKDCIQESYNNTVFTLKENIKEKVLNDLEVQKVVKELIVYSAMFQNEGTVFTDIVDILELGICDVESIKQVATVDAHPNYTATSNSKQKRVERNIEIAYYTIREPAVFDACIKLSEDMNWDKESLILKEVAKLFQNSIYSQGVNEKSSEKGKVFEKLCFANIAKDCRKTVKISKLPFFPVEETETAIIFEDIEFKVINFGTTQENLQVPFDKYLATVALLHKKRIKNWKSGFIILSCHQMKHIQMDCGLHNTKISYILFFGLVSAIKESHCATLIDRLFMNNYLVDRPDDSHKREQFAVDYLGKVIDNKKASKRRDIEKKDSIIGAVLRVHVHAAKKLDGIRSAEIPVKLLDDVTLPPMFSIDIGLENLDKIISDKVSLEMVKQCILKGKAIDT